jgi:DNA recombination protein RmuC
VSIEFGALLVVVALAFLATGVLLGRRMRSGDQTASIARLEAERGAALAQAEERRSEAARLVEELRALRAEAVDLRGRLVAAETAAGEEREKHAEQLALVEAAETRLRTAFQAVAGEALKGNTEQFLALARQALAAQQEQAKGDLAQRQEAIAGLVGPVQTALKQVDEKIAAMELGRAGAYQGLTEQVRFLQEGQAQLRAETANLVKALRAPHTRGRWGEVQLRRVIELAGMVERCDFVEQQHMASEEGALRPDVIVQLPGGRSMVIDAKVPLMAYLEAIEAADDETRDRRLADHARQVRQHVKTLAGKAYWSRLPLSPEFVVMFVPGDPFLAAAAQADPALVDQSMEDGVVLATPFSLIALLKAVAYGWRQETLAQNAEDIRKAARELYDRLGTMAGHWVKLGKELQGAVGAYNQAVGALESRVLPSGRRIKELGGAGGGRELPALEPVEQAPRALQAPELGAGESIAIEPPGHA